MPKRKREEDEGREESVKKPGGIKEQRVAYKLHHGVKRVAHAFKLAKGFERQKLSRRRKTAQSQQKEQDVERIDAEIVALKKLDHGTAAQQHVYKSLLKIKAVAEHDHLPRDVKKAQVKTTDAPTLNVIARLCKSNQAKEALAPVISDVQNALGLESTTIAKKKRKRAKDYEQEPDVTAAGTTVKPSKPSKKEASATVGNGVDDSEEDDFADLDDRIASSDDEDEGGAPVEDDSDSDQSIGELERQLESEGVQRRGLEPVRPATNGYNHEADLSISDSESNAPSPSPEPQKFAAVKKSSFLPTLTMGGYISGSGSDIEDEVDVAPRKNRRGQRARQQLAEKKYGVKANHLQKGQERDGRKEGWDAKRGATDGTERFGRGGRGGKFGGGGGGGGRGGMNGVQKPVRGGDGGQKAVKKHRDDGGTIHPSWEAAKKAKERKEAPVAFQGKKTTFD